MPGGPKRVPCKAKHENRTVATFSLSLYGGTANPSLQEMTDFAKSAAATGLASTQGADGKGMMGGKLGREVVVQLFKKWVQSDDRTKVRAMYFVVAV